MLNLDIIDKLIAVVVVILGLALFVQSLQALIKKALKLKSLQVEQSLAHLFHYVLNTNQGVDKLRFTDTIPLLRHVLPRTQHPAERDEKVRALYQAVTGEFRKVGRLTWTGKMMLDSIAKEDLTKFLGKVPATDIMMKLFPDAGQKLAEVQGQVASVSAALDLLKGEYRSLLKAEELAPIERLVADVGGVFGGDAFNARTLVSDVVSLQQVDPNEFLLALSEARARIAQALSKAERDRGSAAAVEVLRKANVGLENMADAVTAFSTHIASLRGLVTQVDNWFDTVMQSFEERYARAMRTTTIVLSTFVVILLNANIINIYQDLSTNDARRALVLETVQKYQRSQAPPTTTSPQEPSASPSPTPPTLEGLYREGREVLDKNIADYTSLGFKGPAWVNGIPEWAGRAFSGDRRGEAWWQAMRTLVGWLVMILLLSAGAPFWQDTLESLFGFKNLMRKRSGTPNVAGPSGAGQQKP